MKDEAVVKIVMEEATGDREEATSLERVPDGFAHTAVEEQSPPSSSTNLEGASNS